jgi:AcrR family transcriptional regulator
VPRSGADARRRLQQAALDLYRERGFDQTTAADIAARAGVNERTFFRHFPDKREVLFDGEAELRAALVRYVAEAPGDLHPLQVVRHALGKAARILEDNHPFSAPRLELIAATPALRERDLAKAAAMADTVADALRRRGVPDRPAQLTAQVGWATFHHAAENWIADPSADLVAHLQRAFDELRTLSATPES